MKVLTKIGVQFCACVCVCAGVTDTQTYWYACAVTRLLPSGLTGRGSQRSADFSWRLELIVW